MDSEVLDPEERLRTNNPSVLNRGLILGFMFELLFGPLFGLLKEDADVICYCWRGSIVLMLFSGGVCCGVHSRSWRRSVMVAGPGGYLSHLLWSIPDKPHLANMADKSFGWMSAAELYEAPIVGLSYGIVTALILYVLKFHLAPRLPNKHGLYAISTLSGTVAYPLLHTLIRLEASIQTSGSPMPQDR